MRALKRTATDSQHVRRRVAAVQVSSGGKFWGPFSFSFSLVSLLKEAQMALCACVYERVRETVSQI